jgi:DNA polymerase III subunit epsilon
MFAGWALEYRRRRLLGRAGAGPLREFYRQPFVAGGSDCRELRFVALDLETTGLDPMSDAILSIGLVEIHRQRIDLSSACHVLLRADRPIPEQSVIIHRITDDQAADGERLESVLPGLLARLAGKVLVAHHADFEMRFLGQACQRLYGAGFLMPVIDTQRIARRGLERGNQVIGPQTLRLAECRRRHGLPRYRLHNALSDALACAELFLVQMGQHGDNRPIKLNDFR